MRLVTLFFLAACLGVLRAAPAPQSVAVLFNTSVSESRKLALYYCEQRRIPTENLVGLPLPEKADISRREYEEMIREPLREEFDRRGWWRRLEQGDGKLIPVANEIRVLAICKGVPLRIMKARPGPGDGEAGKPPGDGKKTPFTGRNEASVDSELALLGVEGLPLDGVLANKYFRSSERLSAAGIPFQMLTARLDAADYETCRRMVADAVAVGETGLWGMAYVDIAHKYPEGDSWLESIVAQNRIFGIPTVVEKTGSTFPTNYPMSGASLYYGWYTQDLNGPFRNPNFRFAPGAVAVHIHSFSAVQLTNPNSNWSAGLLAKGAAATVGNVFEPYLGTSHHLDILHQRLLEGFSWVEACWMAMPVCSWQGVVLGDPLYEPFAHLDGTGKIVKDQKPFRALRAAMNQWAGDEQKRHSHLELAAARTNEGVFWEAVGLEQSEKGKSEAAMNSFRRAAQMYRDPPDQLRQKMHQATVERAAKRIDQAAVVLEAAAKQYATIPEAAAATEWLKAVQSQLKGKKPPGSPAGG